MPLPQETGVYLLYDKEGTLLYIGKAKNISKRVAQHKREKTPWKQKIARVDFRLTNSEEDALLLEQNLVSEMLPRYNVRLRDDKSYPYIAISYDEEYPRVYLTREKHKPARRYFGPYTNARRGKQIVKTLARIYPFRSCQGEKPGREANPCLDWHLGLCGAPCVSYISREDYIKNIKKIEKILSGQTISVRKDLKEAMEKASAQKEFEKAALLRDRLHNLESITGKRKRRENYDALVLVEDEVFVFSIRENGSNDTYNLQMKNRQNTTSSNTLSSFLLQYYQKPPREILLEQEIDPLVLRAFEKKFPQTKIIYPQKGEKYHFLERCRKEALLKHATKKQSPKRAVAVERLEKILGKEISRIETYDASNLGKDGLYVSMVVFSKKGRDASEYRIFSLPNQQKVDDYKALGDALQRRKISFEKALRSRNRGEKYDSSFIQKPDLILIDGGKGQLNIAQESLSGFVPSEVIFSLAKRKETIFNNKRDYSWDEEIEINLLFREMRDEAHRFALRHNRRSRRIHDPLESVPGIGKKRKALLRESIKDVELASIEELTSVPGISLDLAEKIYRQFNQR